MKILFVILGSLILMQTACTQTPVKDKKVKPDTYQQQFDSALDTLNDALGVYAQLDCTDPNLTAAAKAVASNLDKFTVIFKAMPIPIDRNGTRDIELSYGMLDLVDSVQSMQEKCFLKDAPVDSPNSTKSM